MAQARRKTPARKNRPGGSSLHGIGMLVTGIVIGSLGTILWQGTQVADGGVGTGIRKMIEQSRVSDQDGLDENGTAATDIPVKQETNFDFFTVLPEIEVVVPAEEPEKNTVNGGNPDQPDPAGAQQNAQDPETGSSAYMLQAGSYQRKSEAENLKAELALMGHAAAIQKVTIQDKGDFFRVRLGPYANHDEMVKVDMALNAQGIKALRLKISRGG